MNPRVRERTRRRLDLESADIGRQDDIRLKMLLIFPAPYPIAMASLGFQVVYYHFNTSPGVLCHRAFLPDPDLLPLYESGGELLRSLESTETFSDYDVIAFSLNYEHQLVDMLRILRFGRVPLTPEERIPETHPLVIAGGVISTINPEPLAPFMDACVLGEGEEVISELSESLQNHWSRRRNRHEALEVLSRIKGIYVPSFYTPRYNRSGVLTGLTYSGPEPEPKLERRITSDLDSYPGSTVIHTPETEFGDMHILEVSRGCPGGCRFCLIPATYPPFRTRSLSILKNTADRTPEKLRIGLLGAGVSFHPNLTDLCRYLIDKGHPFSISSLHAASISEPLAEVILQSGTKTVTLAPETGVEKRRKVIGKSLSDQQLFHAISLLGRPPVRTIKLYFMVGLPGDTETSVDDIVETCKHAQHIIVSQNKGNKMLPRVVAGVSCFVPKAGSPFQRAPMADETRLRHFIKRLDQQFRKVKSIRWTHDVPKWSVVQGLIARGDRRMGLMLREIAERKTTWRNLLRTMPINPGFIVYRKRPLNELLPWYHIERGFA